MNSTYSNKLLITDYRLPITDYRLPITDYRLPITDYRLPITDYRLLITDYQSSSQLSPPDPNGNSNVPRHRLYSFHRFRTFH